MGFVLLMRIMSLVFMMGDMRLGLGVCVLGLSVDVPRVGSLLLPSFSYTSQHKTCKIPKPLYTTPMEPLLLIVLNAIVALALLGTALWKLMK